MDAPQPGHFWKTPFIWEPGCAEPPAAASLNFISAPQGWLVSAMGEVMSTSLDESDNHAVQALGAEGAAEDLLAFWPEYFEKPIGWWRAAEDEQGQKVGFVLPVLFKDRAKWKEDKPQGTIFYMGVLPQFRGRRYAQALVHEATRIFKVADCWRIFCDASSRNAPMLQAFRQAGYIERSPWQRPVA